MNLARYPFGSSQDFLEYEFSSEGPNGRIEKRIRFAQVSSKPKIFNVAFGDLDLATGLISDKNISNNKDTDKILATVAASVITFF